MIYHYPVQWPIGWPKTASWQRTSGGFKVAYDEAERDLALELERLGADSAYISTDQELRVTGTPRRDKAPASPAVALYFVRNGQQLCIPCDKFDSVRGNIRAIGLTIQNIRQMERYGTNRTVEATLAGFAALPAEASQNVGPRAWYEVLEVSPNASPEVIKASFRAKAAQTHPDAQAGSTAAFQEVKRAYDQGMEAAS